MSGNPFLDTGVLAVSLFNTMLLLWLGIVVVSNADRRSGGIWLASLGLLCGGIFFLIHTAIIGRGLREATGDLDLLWHLGWIPIIAAPLAWNVVMLWYTGNLAFRPRRSQTLYWIHLPGLVFVAACAVLLLVLIFGFSALPTFADVVTFGRKSYLPTAGAPLLVIVYALYNIACIALAIHALRHPEPSARWMGDLARQRARPWLTAASLVLLVVSLLVSAFVVVLYFAYSSALAAREDQVRDWIALFDLMVGALVAAAVVLIGKATVSYEIFTGKTLPRRGFLRQWRRAVILAAGYSVLIAAAVTLALPLLYALLVATILLVVFYALLSVRTFGERERIVRELRPLLAPAGPDHADSVWAGRVAFDSLCAHVLNVRVGYLCPYSALVTPLAYPPERRVPSAEASQLAVQFSNPGENFRAVSPGRFGGAVWAIPLWSERGLNGVLLIGERNDGGLYTQEEIEIAQATGERVLEAQASAALTRRLIELQRSRLAATQVVDRRARRVLHDDILPQLHAAVLGLGDGTPETVRQARAQLLEIHHALSDLLRDMPAGEMPQLERYGVFGALRRAVEQEFGASFERVEWQIAPEAEARARSLSALNAEVLFAAAREAIRNAAKHGRGTSRSRPLYLAVSAQWQDGLLIAIQDDGVGVSASSNGGQGLRLHSTMMAVIGGTFTISHALAPRHGTWVTLQLPETALA